MGRFSLSINSLFNKLVESNKKEFSFYLLFLPLYILSTLYGFGIKSRLFLYHIGMFKILKLGCRVVSVGNITVGGSGKTPIAMYLAQRFIEKGKRPVILSRGYKGKIRDMGIVSDGKDVLLNPEDAGDEPYLMATKLKTVPVIVGRDRYKAGLYAIEKFNPDIIILDDGFQHIRLARDVDILLVDSRRVFGNGYLFPLGILREPLSGLKRATLVLLKKSKVWGLPLQALSRGQESEEKNIAKLTGRMKDFPIIPFAYKPVAIRNIVNDARLNIDFLKGKRVATLSGIADPKSFKGTIEGLGAVVIREFVYPDHYNYTSYELNSIVKQMKDIEILITTEKDAVKLEKLQIGNLSIFALEIDIHIKNSDMFNKAVGLNAQ
ncbi:MAG TPA: tetraacyldisaccharide 4'-kinase [Deltaproteobacteria bacterium]|nr:tetraacyldisaccharide 4'-kinase [Deltaproteobacteria bacterium]